MSIGIWPIRSEANVQKGPTSKTGAPSPQRRVDLLRSLHSGHSAPKGKVIQKVLSLRTTLAEWVETPKPSGLFNMADSVKTESGKV